MHIEKRRYRKGYYVEVIKKNKGSEISTIETINTKVEIKKNETIQLEVLASSEIDSLKPVKFIRHSKKPISAKKTFINKRPDTRLPFKKKLGGDECDVIYMIDGTEVEVLIVSISDTEIAYKKCNFADGPTYKVSTSKIKKIDLKNGDEYIPEATKGTSSTSVTGGMIASIVLAGIAFLGILIGAIVIFSFGGVGYYGIGLIFGGIPLVIAGITSLIGLIIGATFLKKDTHPLGKAGFIANLILQVLAIILTVLMFVI